VRKINVAVAITIKHRVKAGEIEGMNIVGEIKGKHCIIVDDMIDTGLLSLFVLLC
jgi:ribose-phosphate pyrophosphokinase